MLCPSIIFRNIPYRRRKSGKRRLRVAKPEQAPLLSEKVVSLNVEGNILIGGANRITPSLAAKRQLVYLGEANLI